MSRARVFLVMALMLIGLAIVVVPSHAAMSQIRGTIYWYDQYGNLHPMPWVQVVATSLDGDVTTAASTTDGTYVMWVAPGTYSLSVSSDPGFVPQTVEVTVPDGGVVPVDFNLEPTGEPIPEYPSIVQPILVFVAALSAAVMIRRSRRT